MEISSISWKIQFLKKLCGIFSNKCLMNLEAIENPVKLNISTGRYKNHKSSVIEFFGRSRNLHTDFDKFCNSILVNLQFLGNLIPCNK
jgi:hypothetical protein